jgi:hypothetical protein
MPPAGGEAMSEVGAGEAGSIRFPFARAADTVEISVALGPAPLDDTLGDVSDALMDGHVYLLSASRLALILVRLLAFAVMPFAVSVPLIEGYDCRS